MPFLQTFRSITAGLCARLSRSKLMYMYAVLVLYTSARATQSRESRTTRTNKRASRHSATYKRLSTDPVHRLPTLQITELLVGWMLKTNDDKPICPEAPILSSSPASHKSNRNREVRITLSLYEQEAISEMKGGQTSSCTLLSGLLVPHLSTGKNR